MPSDPQPVEHENERQRRSLHVPTVGTSKIATADRRRKNRKTDRAGNRESIRIRPEPSAEIFRKPFELTGELRYFAPSETSGGPTSGRIPEPCGIATVQKLDAADRHDRRRRFPLVFRIAGLSDSLPDFPDAAGSLLQAVARRAAHRSAPCPTAARPDRRRTGSLPRARPDRPAAGSGHFHLRAGPDRHVGGRGNGHAGRQRRVAGDLLPAEQHGRRADLPGRLLVRRLAGLAASLRLAAAHRTADDSATDPAVRRRTGPATLLASGAPGTEAKAVDLVLPVGRIADDRHGQHDFVPDPSGLLPVRRRAAAGRRLARRMRMPIRYRTPHRTQIRPENLRRTGTGTEKHRAGDLDGANLPAADRLGRPGRLRRVAERHQQLATVEKEEKRSRSTGQHRRLTISHFRKYPLYNLSLPIEIISAVIIQHKKSANVFHALVHDNQYVADPLHTQTVRTPESVVYIPAAKSAFFDGFCAVPDGTRSHINLFGQFFEFLRIVIHFFFRLTVLLLRISAPRIAPKSSRGLSRVILPSQLLFFCIQLNQIVDSPHNVQIRINRRIGAVYSRFDRFVTISMGKYLEQFRFGNRYGFFFSTRQTAK